jgi:hypothetical protein
VKVGDLVRMDFTDWLEGDMWGPGIVVEIERNGSTNDVIVWWSKLETYSWEMSSLLDCIDESR